MTLRRELPKVLDWFEEAEMVFTVGRMIHGMILIQVDKREPYLVRYIRNMDRRPPSSWITARRVGQQRFLADHTNVFGELYVVIRNNFTRIGIRGT